MYKIIIDKFTDLQDGYYKYKKGDTYPREGYDPDDVRVAQLLSNKNRQGVPIIAKDDSISNPAQPEKGEQDPLENKGAEENEPADEAEKPKKNVKAKK